MYPKFIIPFEFIPYEIMNKREADNFFQWFLESQQSRIRTLIEYCRGSEGFIVEKLDFTPESLNYLWNWFVPRIELVKKSREELQEEHNEIPEWLKSEVIVNEAKFGGETETIIIDIGIYFGNVFLQQFSQLKWGVIYKPRNFADVNRPVIIGFNKDVVLNPVRVVNTCTNKVVKGTGNSNLIDLYNVWVKYLE